MFLGGCAAIGATNFSAIYGPSEPRDREVAKLPAGHIDYWNDVQPIIESRCTVCHGCYDAPCQLKLTSLEGIERGASTTLVYDQTRLFEAETSRLFHDAHTVTEWRSKEFFPVLNEYQQSPEANREASVMYQLLQLKSENPLPNTKRLGKEFTLGLSRKQSCPKAELFQSYAQDNPLWGMPYALPALSAEEQQALQLWLEQGALHTHHAQLPEQLANLVAQWEGFLNQDSLKARLASRYIYEHLFLGHIYFDQVDPVDKRRYFRLVRSATPPGAPISLIATRRPYDEPGVERVYYRLQEYKASIVAKTHMPYAFNEQRMARWRELFLERDYEVTSLPGYDIAIAANPFAVFFDIPTSSRYQFMLDEAQYTVMGFIKGPVCRGQVALNVINDHFWVFFLRPDAYQDEELVDFLKDNYQLLELPSAQGSIFRPLANWNRYSKLHQQYLANKDELLMNAAGKRIPLNETVFWDGDGVNDNAALTIFRHNDSATVEKGLVGYDPKTAWLLGYVDLERIHYLLVAGYDVYGNVGHQLLSRLYMDFLRMDGELNFLLFLPQEARERERAFWYRNADPDVLKFVSAPDFENKYRKPEIDYQTNDQKHELYTILKQRMSKTLNHGRSLSSLNDSGLARELDRLNYYIGKQVEFMSDNALLLVETAAGDEYFSLLKNNAHLNMTSMLAEQKNRIPEEDQLMVVRGFVGSYPNAFYKVKREDVSRFVDAIGRIDSENKYSELLDDFGVRRTDPEFWRHSDRLHRGFQQAEPVSYGVLDYNRLENR